MKDSPASDRCLGLCEKGVARANRTRDMCSQKFWQVLASATKVPSEYWAMSQQVWTCISELLAGVRINNNYGKTARNIPILCQTENSTGPGAPKMLVVECTCCSMTKLCRWVSQLDQALPFLPLHKQR